jgi:hypothetical protein
LIQEYVVKFDGVGRNYTWTAVEVSSRKTETKSYPSWKELELAAIKDLKFPKRLLKAAKAWTDRQRG